MYSIIKERFPFFFLFHIRKMSGLIRRQVTFSPNNTKESLKLTPLESALQVGQHFNRRSIYYSRFPRWGGHYYWSKRYFLLHWEIIFNPIDFIIIKRIGWPIMAKIWWRNVFHVRPKRHEHTKMALGIRIDDMPPVRDSLIRKAMYVAMKS